MDDEMGQMIAIYLWTLNLRKYGFLGTFLKMNGMDSQTSEE
jgi:hypothetical protein